MLRFSIETMTGCLGRCDGCVFSQAERRDRGVMSESLRHQVTNACHAWRKFYEQDNGWDIKPYFFGCVQADHLLMPQDEIKPFVQWMVEASGGDASCEFTTSLVGKPANVRKLIDEFHQSACEEGISLIPASVYNPGMQGHATFGESYMENFLYAKSRFGSMGVAFNFGLDVLTSMTPEQTHNLALQWHLDLIEPVLSPTLESADAFGYHWNDYAEWLTKYWNLWSKDSMSYDMYFGMQTTSIMQMMDKVHPDEIFDRIVKDLYGRIYIDADGYMYFGQSGLTAVAVPMFRKNGFEPFAHVSEQGTDIVKKGVRYAEKLARRIQRQFMTSKNCSSCMHNKICAMTGGIVPIHLSKKVPEFNPETENCPTGLKKLMDAMHHPVKEGLVFNDTIPFEFIQYGATRNRDPERFIDISKLPAIRAYYWLLDKIDLESVCSEFQSMTGHDNAEILMFELFLRASNIDAKQGLNHVEDIARTPEIAKLSGYSLEEIAKIRTLYSSQVETILERFIEPAIRDYHYRIIDGNLRCVSRPESKPVSPPVMSTSVFGVYQPEQAGC